MVCFGLGHSKCRAWVYKSDTLCKSRAQLFVQQSLWLEDLLQVFAVTSSSNNWYNSWNLEFNVSPELIGHNYPLEWHDCLSLQIVHLLIMVTPTWQSWCQLEMLRMRQLSGIRTFSRRQQSGEPFSSLPNNASHIWMNPNTIPSFIHSV